MSQTGPGGETTSRRKLGGLGAKHQASVRFFVSSWKKMPILLPFGSHFARFQSHLKDQIFEIRKPIKQISLFTSGQVQTTFKILHFGVKFCDLAWSGESRYIAFCDIFSIKSFARRFTYEEFCFVIKTTTFRNMYDQEPRHSRFNFDNLFNKHFH